MKCVNKILKFEVKQLCSDSLTLILKSNSIEDMLSFKWLDEINEADKHLHLLRNCTETSTITANTTAVTGFIISIRTKHPRPPH